MYIFKRQIWYLVTSVRHKTGNLPNDLQSTISKGAKEKLKKISEKRKNRSASSVTHSTNLSIQIHFCKEREALAGAGVNFLLKLPLYLLGVKLSTTT